MKFLSLLLLAIAVLCQSPAYSQEHNVKCMHCRFYKKTGTTNTNSAGTWSECGCKVCYELTQKEELAKRAEEKKRNDAMVAQQKAEQQAKELARKEAAAKKKKEEEELKARKDAEEKQTAATQAELYKKNDEIAKKGVYRAPEPSKNTTAVSGTDSLLQAFDDTKSGVYGIKLGDDIIVSKNFGEYPEVSISKIGKSSYFRVCFKQKNHEGFLRASFFMIMDKKGEFVKVDGHEKFNWLGEGNDGNFQALVHTSEFRSMGEPVFDMAVASERQFETQEAADAFYQKRKNAGYKGNLGRFYHFKTCNAVSYILDWSIKIVEKKNIVVVTANKD